MFKRLFFLSGIIAFVLASAVMYFWYLPRHSEQHSAPNEQDRDARVDSTGTDTLNITMPLE